jgi:hypothetical protein
MTQRLSRLWRTVALALLLPAGPALACGFEDPGNAAVQRGLLNFAFPKALWVQTAVWQAQAAGLLARDTSLPGNRALLGFRRATDALASVAGYLDADASPVPAFTLVMIGPVLWTRFADDGQGLKTTPHVNGPAAGDIVVVTDEPVVLALTAGRIGGAEALDRGLIRIYGKAAGVAALDAAIRRIGG